MDAGQLTVLGFAIFLWAWPLWVFLLLGWFILRR